MSAQLDVGLGLTLKSVVLFDSLTSVNDVSKTQEFGDAPASLKYVEHVEHLSDRADVQVSQLM